MGSSENVGSSRERGEGGYESSPLRPSWSHKSGKIAPPAPLPWTNESNVLPYEESDVGEREDRDLNKSRTGRELVRDEESGHKNPTTFPFRKTSVFLDPSFGREGERWTLWDPCESKRFGVKGVEILPLLSRVKRHTVDRVTGRGVSVSD